MKRLLERRPDVHLSISVTTRRPRSAEREGVDYAFVTDAEFDRMASSGELLEWAEIFGHRSGTPGEPISKALEAGRDALLEIDVQGAEQVRRRVPDAVLILLAPPSMDELERRLRSRGTEDAGLLERRLAKAVWELGQARWFDHVVVNDDLERATAQVEAILRASRRSSGDARPGDA